MTLQIPCTGEWFVTTWAFISPSSSVNMLTKHQMNCFSEWVATHGFVPSVRLATVCEFLTTVKCLDKSWTAAICHCFHICKCTTVRDQLQNQIRFIWIAVFFLPEMLNKTANIPVINFNKWQIYNGHFMAPGVQNWFQKTNVTWKIDYSASVVLKWREIEP